MKQSGLLSATDKKFGSFRYIKLFPICGFLLLNIILLNISCSLIPGYKNQYNKKGLTRQAEAMGTYIQITLFTPPSPTDGDLETSCKSSEELLDELVDDVLYYGTLFGKYSPEGDIYKVNDAPFGSSVKVDPLTADLITKSLHYAEETEGLFDPSINPVVSLWRRYRKENRVPPTNEITEALSLVDYKKVIVNSEGEESFVSLENKGAGLDLGGIAKGYIADILFKKLKENGVSSAIINLGGNVHIRGTKQWGKPFLVGIQDPDSEIGYYIGVVAAEDQAVVTSGDYQRFVIIDGKKYHHIIDPRTGSAGISDLRSATIVSSSGTAADALATGVFLMGLDKGRDFVENNPDIEAILITADSGVYISSGLKDKFTLIDTEYRIIP